MPRPLYGGRSRAQLLRKRKILHSGLVENIYVQPASSDAGVALGAAVYRYVQLTGKRPDFVFDHAFYGPSYGDSEIEQLLKEAKVPYERVSDIAEKTAELLGAGKIIGWFQGRMEVGPRALGGRSILADPSIPGIKDKVTFTGKVFWQIDSVSVYSRAPLRLRNPLQLQRRQHPIPDPH